jgi:hypothetical protein
MRDRLLQVRSIRTVICVLGALLALSCSSVPRESAPRATGTVGPQDDFVVRPNDGLGPVKFGSTQDQVRDACGEPDRGADGQAWEYLSRGFAVVFDKPGNVRSICCGDGCLRGSPPTVSPLVAAFKARTAQGVGMGSSRAMIESAFGKTEAEQPAPDYLVLTYPKIGTRFTLYQGKLIHIMMQRAIDTP